MAKKITPKKFAEVSAGVRLSSHERICAIRHKHILENLQELNKEVKSLRNHVSTGKGMVSVLVFLGTIAAACIGYLNIK
jgi:hypothetical protein